RLTLRQVQCPSRCTTATIFASTVRTPITVIQKNANDLALLRHRNKPGFIFRGLMATKKLTMGVIVGNRGFFPDHLAKSGREEMINALQRAGVDVVAPSPEQTKYGAVETHEEAKRCAGLFRANQDRLDGIVVTLPNFGDERAVADTLRLAHLDVPVLIQATPDIPAKMTIAFRR